MMEYGLFDVSRRIFPSSPAAGPKSLTVDVARGECGACQLSVRRDAPPMEWALDVSTGTKHWTPLAVGNTASNGNVRLRVTGGPSDMLQVRVRAVGNVPLLRHAEDTPREELDGDIPGMVPDVLLEKDQLNVGVLSTAVFWISFRVPPDMLPGTYNIVLTLDEPAGGAILESFCVEIKVYPIALAADDRFWVTHWVDVGSLYCFYQTSPDSEQFWDILERYLDNLRRHGNTMLWIPFLEPVRIGKQTFPQLLTVAYDAAGELCFDWSLVERYVNLGKKLGFYAFEFEHLASPWGASLGRNPDLLVTPGKYRKLWRRPPAAPGRVYSGFLRRMLTSLGEKLQEWEIDEQIFLHISDEPQPRDLKNYLAISTLVREVMPRVKIIDALSDYEFIDAEALDVPVPIVGCVNKFKKANKKCMCYFCCGPKLGYVNRFLDTPLQTIRMTGWLLYRFEVDGFLHWAFNYWRRYGSSGMIDPYHINDAGNSPAWPGGDCFVVYPGENGPIDSIRSELFYFGLQDRRLLRSAGIRPDSDQLSPLADFNCFPGDPQWINRQRREILQASLICPGNR